MDTITQGQQLTFATGHRCEVIEVIAPPIPLIYVRNPDGTVWSDSPRGMATRLSQ